MSYESFGVRVTHSGVTIVKKLNFFIAGYSMKFNKICLINFDNYIIKCIIFKKLTFNLKVRFRD